MATELKRLKGRKTGVRGRFESIYSEPRGEAIALRLPQSLDERLRKAVGWQSKDDNDKLKAAVEAAIKKFLGETEADIDQEILRDAAQIAIAIKQAAIAREEKKKSKADADLINKWLGEIEQLSVLV